MGWRLGERKRGRGGGLLRKSAFVSFFSPLFNCIFIEGYEVYKFESAKRTRKSIQVDASLQNQNLRRDLRWAAKRIRKSQKAVNFTHVQLTSHQLVSTCIRWPNGEKLGPTCVRI